MTTRRDVACSALPEIHNTRTLQIRILGVSLLAMALSACSDAGRHTAVGPSDAPPAPRPSLAATRAACGTSTDRQVSERREATTIYLLSRPEAGESFSDPNFGACITRLTDHATEPPVRFARNAYSRRQSFNADDTRVLIMAGDGAWHLYDPTTVRHVTALTGLVGDIEPQWHPIDPDRLYHLPEEGLGMQLIERDIVTGSTRVVADLGTRLRARWPTAAILSTRSDGYPSRDGRYWAWLVETVGSIPLGIVVWDRDLDRLVALRDVDAQTGRDIDWVSMSPSGEFVVVAGDAHTRAFTRQLVFHGNLHDAVEHADLAIGAGGRDVYVSVDFATREGWLFMVGIDTLARTNLVSTYTLGDPVAYTSLHVSGKAFERPGWVVVSTYHARSERTEWFQDKVMLVELAPSAATVRLADHYSNYAGYWTEPHASSNRDASMIIYNSNWNSTSETDVDAWLIDVPSERFDVR